MLIRTIGFAAFFLVVGSTAVAQTAPEQAGQRLIARSGVPDRFMLEADAQSIVIIDSQSGLRCSIPPNAPQMNLTVSENLVECGYSGGIHTNWMITPLSSGAGRAPLDRFVAAYALFQKEQHPTWDVTAPPPRIEALRRIFPNAPQSFHVWLRDTRENSDTLISLMAADINGHRVMQMVAGPSDPVTAMSELAFVTATTPSPPP